MTDKAFRKTALNTAVVFFCLFTTSVITPLIPDNRLAFTVSAISISVAALASMFVVAWPIWIAYLNGDLEGDYEPYSLRELLTLAWTWIQKYNPRTSEHEERRHRPEDEHQPD